MALNANYVAPSFTCNDIEKSIAFYQALGFEVTDRTEHEGKLVFAMLQAGGAQLGLGQDDFKKGRDRQKGIGTRMWISTNDDLNALCDTFKKAGFRPDNEPQALPWGPLAFAVTDPDGFLLTISNG